MRPFAFAAVAAALAGCSIPYAGKTFSAIPKPSHSASGHGQVSDHGQEHENSGAVHMEAHGAPGSDRQATPDPHNDMHVSQGLYGADKDDTLPTHPSARAATGGASSAIGETPIVFPPTAQPTGMPPSQRNQPAAAHSEGH